MAKDLVNVVTPVGELHWVNISGQGKENFNEDGYEYVATVHLEGDKAKDLKAKIDALIANPPEGKKLKSTGYRELLRNEDGELFTPTADNKEGEKTGIYAFTFRTGTTYEDGKTKVVSVYNCAKPPQKVKLGDKRIGNGSKGAISGKMRMFERGKEYGVSLFLHAIQLTNFKEYEDGAGFEEQEGDFYDVGEGEGFANDEAETPTETKETPKADKPKTKPKL